MLTEAEVRELEATLLPALERHHLRILAHGLRTLQTIAGRREGPLPLPAALEAWAVQQPEIAADPGFCEAFRQQLVVLADQLTAIAETRRTQPLALDLADLAAWARARADHRLHEAALSPTEEGLPPAG